MDQTSLVPVSPPQTSGVEETGSASTVQSSDIPWTEMVPSHDTDSDDHDSNDDTLASDTFFTSKDSGQIQVEQMPHHQPAVLEPS
jgi:hypothetical protein